MATIFISHSGADDALATDLENWLGLNGFDEVFVDHGQNGIRVGDKWQRALQSAVGACRVVICLVTENWLRSKECDGEFIAARYMGKKIIPLLGVDPDIPEALNRDPSDAAGRYRDSLLRRVLREDQGSDIRSAIVDGKLDFSHAFQQAETLIRGLRAAGALSNVGIDPSAFEIDRARLPSPFPGLSAFDDEDHHAAIFYGRDPEIISCLEHLRQARANSSNKPIGIIGASGSGKSSLMRAGILPRLRRERPWICLRAFRPGADPLLSFADAIARTLRENGVRQAAGSMAQELRAAWEGAERDDDSNSISKNGIAELRVKLDEIADQLRDRTNRPAAVCLISLDQAEELFESTRDDADILADYMRAAILPQTQIDESEDDDAPLGGGWRLLFTIRTDSYAAFQSHHRFRELEADGIDLRPLPIWRFDNAIDGPAARYGVSIEGNLIDRLVSDAPGEDSLPLLAFTMQRLFLHSDGEAVTLDDYEMLGGISGILEDAAERAMRRISPNDDRVLPNREPSKRVLEETRELFIPNLVSLNAEGKPVRHIADMRSFDDAGQEAILAFLDWRLLVRRTRMSPDSDDNIETIEVAHEAIFREWSRLVKWLEPEKERLEALRLMKSSALVWHRHNRRRAYCDHRGIRLREAQSLAEDSSFTNRLDQVDLDYLAACQKNKNAARIPYMFGALAAVVGLMILGLFANAYLDEQRAQTTFDRIVEQTKIVRTRQLSSEVSDSAEAESANRRAAAIQSVDWLEDTVQQAEEDVLKRGLDAASDHILGYQLNTSTGAVIAVALSQLGEDDDSAEAKHLKLAYALWLASDESYTEAETLANQLADEPDYAPHAFAALAALEFKLAEENGFIWEYDATQISQAGLERTIEGTCQKTIERIDDFERAGGFELAKSARGGGLNLYYWRGECLRKRGRKLDSFEAFQAGVDAIMSGRRNLQIASGAPDYNPYIWRIYRGLGTTGTIEAKDARATEQDKEDIYNRAEQNLDHALNQHEYWGANAVALTFTSENKSFIELSRSEIIPNFNWGALDASTARIARIVPLYWNESVRLITKTERAKRVETVEACDAIAEQIFEIRARLVGIGEYERENHEARRLNLEGEAAEEAWSKDKLGHRELEKLVPEPYLDGVKDAGRWVSENPGSAIKAYDVPCKRSRTLSSIFNR
ncbi:MAG: toll/interleukin-1 receptor domain-containing protein [Pseudomonadota bacterium]